MARQRGRQGRSIDVLRWTGDTLINFAAISAPGAALSLFQAGETSKFTIMRTRGRILVALDSTAADGDAVLVTVGMKVVPKGTDAMVLINPVSEAEGDWFVWDTTALIQDISQPIQSGASWYRFDIDSKAMRRLGPGQQIQLNVANATLGTAQAINAFGQIRMLLGS